MFQWLKDFVLLPGVPVQGQASRPSLLLSVKITMKEADEKNPTLEDNNLPLLQQREHGRSRPRQQQQAAHC